MDEALESLESQGMGDNLEVIIQDGDVESDSGQSDALNKGFAKANGEWLFWLNADDVLLTGALKSVEFRVQGAACAAQSPTPFSTPVSGAHLMVLKTESTVSIEASTEPLM